jgi:hypothetical protein
MIKYDLPTDRARELDTARLKQLQRNARYNRSSGRAAKKYLPTKLKEVKGESFRKGVIYFERSMTT